MNEVMAKQLKATIKTQDGFDEVFEFIKGWDFEQPCKIHIYGGGATLDYKAIFWIWMRSFSEQFNGRGRPTDKAGLDLHDIFCYQFLGMLPEKALKNSVIPARLRTITYPKNLNKGQWHDFMRKIEEKSQSWGLTIPENEDNEYHENKRKSES